MTTIRVYPTAFNPLLIVQPLQNWLRDACAERGEK
jgi:hypothetical protein